MSNSPAPPQRYIVADDDDVNDEDIPGFTQPSVHEAVPLTPAGRTPLEPVILTPNPALSGNIGSLGGTSTQGYPSSTRQEYGGVRVETRYAYSRLLESLATKHFYRYSGIDTLDEPVTATIVRDFSGLTISRLMA
jgi:hypothetical protein